MSEPSNPLPDSSSRWQGIPATNASSMFRSNPMAAMLIDLEANRGLLEDLVAEYCMFRLTGGGVRTEPWSLDALTAYLGSPFTLDLIDSNDVRRYCEAAERIIALGESIAVGKPRSLRTRWDIGNDFDKTAAEFRSLGLAFEAVLAANCEVNCDEADSGSTRDD